MGGKADMPKIIDLTHKLTKLTPVCAYDDPVSLEKTRNLVDDKYNDWKLTCGMHVGTHIDGPGHLTESNILLSDFPVEKFVGRGYLIDARNKPIDESLLKDLQVPESVGGNAARSVAGCMDGCIGRGLQDGLIVLILTGYDKKFGSKEYFEDHPVISVEFAHALAKRKVKMVGIDFFSPDKYPFDTHKVFFDHNVLIIENLTNLERLVGIKDFTVVALPIKTETDSALARVIAIVN